MAQCEVCGNDYHRSFKVVIGERTHVFDSIECAAEIIAPECGHCQCRILGHGVEADGEIFCCDHCARAENGDDDPEPESAAVLS